MLVGDIKSERTMDAKNKRHSTGEYELNKDKLIARARYRSPPAGSCHDFCKLGHKSEFEIKMKAPPSPRKVMLRTQSERKYVPEVAPSIDSSLHKTAFKRLSLPGPGVEKQTWLHTNEIKSPGNSHKKPIASPNRKAKEINGVVKDEKKKPVLPLSASCKSKPPPKRLITTKAKDGVEPKANEKKVEQRQREEKESSTWRKKFRKATATILSSANSSPMKLLFRRPENKGEDQNCEVEDEKIMLKKVEVEREEPRENGGETGEVVVLRHHETMEKEEENVVKETAPEPIMSRKDMVKALVGAFEALISVGDRRSLMAASAS